MKFYSVLVKKNQSDDSFEDAVVLHDGFSFSVFLFGAFWFLYHKMWCEFALILFTNFLILNLPALADLDKFILELALTFIVAVNANSWFAIDLQKRGYKFSGMVGATNSLDAKLRFFQNFAL